MPTKFSFYFQIMLEKCGHNLNQYGGVSNTKSQKDLNKSKDEFIGSNGQTVSWAEASLMTGFKDLNILKDPLPLFSNSTALSVSISPFWKASPWGEQSLQWLAVKVWCDYKLVYRLSWKIIRKALQFIYLRPWTCLFGR